jgi:hypothetical protein
MLTAIRLRSFVGWAKTRSVVPTLYDAGGHAELYPPYDHRVDAHNPSLRAKRSNPSGCTKKEWIASSQELLAMTFRYNFAFSPRIAPELMPETLAPKMEGAGKAGCPLHPQPRV